MQVSANGSPVNAICSCCGAALKYVYYLDGKPLGSTCFTKKTGLDLENLRGYIDESGNINLQKYETDRAAAKKSREELEADAAARVARIAAENDWLIQELLPWANFDHNGYANNFAAGLVRELRDLGVEAKDWSSRAKSIVVDILSKGYRGKKRDARVEEIWEKGKFE